MVAACVHRFQNSSLKENTADTQMGNYRCCYHQNGRGKSHSAQDSRSRHHQGYRYFEISVFCCFFAVTAWCCLSSRPLL